MSQWMGEEGFYQELGRECWIMVKLEDKDRAHVLAGETQDAWEFRHTRVINTSAGEQLLDRALRKALQAARMLLLNNTGLPWWLCWERICL